MENSFTIKQDLTFSDYLTCIFYNHLSNKLVIRLFLFLVSLAILTSILGVVAGMEKINLNLITTRFLPIILLSLTFLIVEFLISWLIYIIKPSYFKNVTYEFTHWGVNRKGGRTEFARPWREIYKFKETKTFFLIYNNNNNFFPVQKRAFNTTEETNSFRNFLSENIAQ